MKIICRINNVYSFRDLSLRKRVEKYKDEDSGEIYLELGKIYTVYGIFISNNIPLFLICPEIDVEYPVPFDPAFFEMVDGRFSSFWRLSFCEYEKNTNSISIVFEEWAKDPSFYEKLLNGELKEMATFTRYRKIMDEEFIDKNKIEKEIQTELIGKIIEGESKGEYIVINEYNKFPGGYFLKVFSNPDSIASPDFEDWFDTYEKMENYYREQGWKVKWFT